MRKRSLQSFSESKTQSLVEIQAKWYGILEKDGFDDQENSRYADRPLKRWSGISDVYIDQFQPPGPIISSFPESLYRDEKAFQNNPEFKALCKRMGEHGNSKLTPRKVKGIWKDYIEGRTERQSELRYRVSDTTVFRVIHTITEWMNLMDTKPKNPGTDENTTIVLRAYNNEDDAAIVYSTWRNALWYDEKRDERFSTEFYALATKEIKKLLSLPDTKIRIACAEDEPDFIVGYSVTVKDHLEFIYVKIKYRKKGIASLLARGALTVAPPQTKMGKKLVELLKLKVKELNGKNIG